MREKMHTESIAEESPREEVEMDLLLAKYLESFKKQKKK